MSLSIPERFEPEDFRVDEIPAYPPSGAGGHTFLHIEKRGRTTEMVARDFARIAGVRPRDIGYAGRKDRHAVTTQWFSVPDLNPDIAAVLELPDVRILEAVPHDSKLRTGHLRGNRFTVTLHGVDPVDADAAAKRLTRLAEHGMPNRFGRQRFGRDGDNAERGLRLLAGAPPGRERREARFLLSALQSAIFNEALRLRGVPLGEVELGDVAVVMASGGLFLVEDLEREAPRAAAFEISASGPMIGTRSGHRDPAPTGEPADREAAAARAVGVDPDAPIQLAPGLRLPGSRRSLRVRPGEVEAHHEGDQLRLVFTLPSGSYATVLLEELASPA